MYFLDYDRVDLICMNEKWKSSSTFFFFGSGMVFFTQKNIVNFGLITCTIPRIILLVKCSKIFGHIIIKPSSKTKKTY